MLTVPREKPKGKNEGCYCGFCLCIKENCCLNTIFRMERLIRSRGLRYYCCRLHQGEGRLQKRSSNWSKGLPSSPTGPRVSLGPLMPQASRSCLLLQVVARHSRPKLSFYCFFTIRIIFSGQAWATLRFMGNSSSEITACHTPFFSVPCTSVHLPSARDIRHLSGHIS
jgi:hypothetical protein